MECENQAQHWHLKHYADTKSCESFHCCEPISAKNPSLSEKTRQKGTFRSEQLILALEKCIAKASDVPNYYLGERVIKECYEVGKNGVILNDEEGERIGPLINNCFKTIKSRLFRHAYLFDANYIPDYLIFRSGLQFMLENYKRFPTGDGKQLNILFEDTYFIQFISEFDTNLKDWKNSSEKSFNSVEHTELQLLRPEQIPENHTWWFEKGEFEKKSIDFKN
ncbi:uncharacterized protein LOC131949833 [Physella acuta]|uniref:uncharacterized protein LOC131949833 n=1 Tax=Physella acuta TaxID=109671 RepID=UPI0027DC4E06|nr:uncharacterized protein LOC131949833 [Physella acuta]